MNDSSDELGEASLAVASARIFAMTAQNFVEFFWSDESEVFEVIFERFVGLVEPELIEIEDGSFFAIKPNSVAFGLAEFATGDFVDNEWARVAVGRCVFETRNEMNARGTVAKLVGAAELKCNIVLAEEVQEIVALDEGVAKLGVRDAGTTFADAILDELAVEQLGHAKTFADFAQERQEFDIFEPVEIVDDGGILVGVGDADDLTRESGFVVLNFVERLELAFGVVFWIADLASGATNQEIWSITMAYEASAHHESSEVADVKTISGRVGAPIKIAWSFV